MDNCEVYRGLADLAQTQELLGDAEAGRFWSLARQVAAGVEKTLWDRRRGCYCPAVAAGLGAGPGPNHPIRGAARRHPLPPGPALRNHGL
jgi:hypothetical protein